MTITIEQVNARLSGPRLPSMKGRSVCTRSSINVNAYHQPGVEAGKKAAQATIQLQSRVFAFLRNEKGKAFAPDEIASVLHMPEGAVKHIQTSKSRGSESRSQDQEIGCGSSLPFPVPICAVDERNGCSTTVKAVVSCVGG